MAAAPDIPTARELGFDVVASTYNLMAAPVNAPAERIDVLSRALESAMKNRDFQASCKRRASTRSPIRTRPRHAPGSRRNWPAGRR
jgi:tripartite-type tricarboxylate transporter receptor subunit TctC